MTTFDEILRALIPFLVIWIVYTFLIYRKAKKCGTSFMNQSNVFFIGYVGFTIGLVVTMIVSTFRL